MGIDIASIVGGWILVGVAGSLSNSRSRLARRWPSADGHKRTGEILSSVGFSVAGVAAVDFFRRLTEHESMWPRAAVFTAGVLLIMLVSAAMFVGPRTAANRLLRRNRTSPAVEHPVPSRAGSRCKGPAR